MVKSKYIIVGAGVSGLTTAKKLMQNGESDFLILEGRSRIGGRILTQNNVDLGATWFQKHHTYLNDLLQALEIKSFNQYSKGKSVLVYNTMAPAHYFESDQNQPTAQRIINGSGYLINTLAEGFLNKILKETEVLEVHEVENTIRVKTNKGLFTAEKLIITLPPKLAVKLKYTPELPTKLSDLMRKTHTWMSNAIKVGITYKTPFWRENRFSGTVIGQVGAVIELYDHNSADGKTFSLMGFINEGLRDLPTETRKRTVLEYLETYLGHNIQDYLEYQEKDWSQDCFTSCENLKSLYMSPRYGSTLFNDVYLNGKVLFSGTETSPVYGGYLDGAVYSGLRAAKYILDN